jgi:Amidohydrolase family
VEIYSAKLITGGPGMMRAILFCLLFLSVSGSNAADIVINNGRVMDPETGLDAIRNIAIEDGQIVSISEYSLKGNLVIDASGLIVAPGFIDLHAHGQDEVSNRFQAADGVTTALELEIGVLPVSSWYDARKGKAPINYGASVSHPYARGSVFAEKIADIKPEEVTPEQAFEYAAHHAPDDQDRVRILKLIRSGIEAGGLGIGMGITYTPAADHQEIYSVFQLAAVERRPVFVHLRNASQSSGDPFAPLQEVLANAAATGAALHVVHLNSSLGEKADTGLGMIRGMRERGLDVSSENYPYTAGSTRLESALFDNWDSHFDRLQWVATGERLTRESFDQYRKEGGWVIIHGRSETMNAWLVAQPDLIIASDGIPFVDGLSHPRSAGTFARILGRYVREEKKLTLMQAITKMTLMPARRLESFAPDMKRKGRIQPGADADITIFDPAEIIDKATYTSPAQYSAGIRYVMVNGTLVLNEGDLVSGVFPGEGIRAASQ